MHGIETWNSYVRTRRIGSQHNEPDDGVQDYHSNFQKKTLTNTSQLKKLELWGAVFGIVFGTMMHFAYAWSGHLQVVGWFAAVNESVWEHTKLLVTPVLIFAVVEWRVLALGRTVLLAKALELLFGIVFIIAFFYTYTGALGIQEILIIDILSFFVAVILGKYISYRILRQQNRVSDEVIVAAGCAVVMLVFLQILFTYASPSLPLFVSK